MKLCREGLWHVKLHEYRQARLKGRIDCAGRCKSTYGAPTSHNPQARRTIRKSKRRHNFLPQARQICSVTVLLKIIQSCPVSYIVQSEQAFTPPTHFRTLFGFSEKFGNCRPPLTYRRVLFSFWPSNQTIFFSLRMGRQSTSKSRDFHKIME